MVNPKTYRVYRESQLDEEKKNEENCINLFLPTVPSLPPLKTPGRNWFLLFSGGYKMGTHSKNRLPFPNLKIFEQDCDY